LGQVVLLLADKYEEIQEILEERTRKAIARAAARNAGARAEGLSHASEISTIIP
jgi:hypothetical protein